MSISRLRMSVFVFLICTEMCPEFFLVSLVKSVLSCSFPLLICKWLNSKNLKNAMYSGPSWLAKGSRQIPFSALNSLSNRIPSAKRALQGQRSLEAMGMSGWVAFWDLTLPLYWDKAPAGVMVACAHAHTYVRKQLPSSL